MQLDKTVIREQYLTQIKEMWLQAEEEFPDFLVPVSKADKRKNESFIKKATKEMKKLSKEKAEQFVFRLLNEEQIIGIHDVMDSETLEDFQEELKRLLRRIRSFAPELDMEGIGQAARNYIVYAMFLELNGVPQNCGDAIFGYSMLYPYTDNFIDNPLHTLADKQNYNQIIRDKIKGLPVMTDSEHIQKTCDLLAAIESAYTRQREEPVFGLLLAMLEAQEESIRQQQKADLSFDDILDISLYKGGISVLIDRYLVPKEMTEEDLRFYLGFGFFLQLADDLQDITEDRNKNSRTVLNYEQTNLYVERMVSKMFHFIKALFEDYRTQKEEFKSFILTNCYQLMYLSITGSGEHLRETYLKRIESYVPVSFAFMEELRENQEKGREGAEKVDYRKLLDEMLKEDTHE